MKSSFSLVSASLRETLCVDRPIFALASHAALQTECWMSRIQLRWRSAWDNALGHPCDAPSLAEFQTAVPPRGGPRRVGSGYHCPGVAGYPKLGSTLEFWADWPEWASTGSKKQQNCPTCPGAGISSVLPRFGLPAAPGQI